MVWRYWAEVMNTDVVIVDRYIQGITNYDGKTRQITKLDSSLPSAWYLCTARD